MLATSLPGGESEFFYVKIHEKLDETIRSELGGARNHEQELRQSRQDVRMVDAVESALASLMSEIRGSGRLSGSPS